MDFYIDENEPEKTAKSMKAFMEIVRERSKHKLEGVRINLRGEVKRVGYRFGVLTIEAYQKLYKEFGDHLDNIATVAYSLFWEACYAESLFAEALINAGELQGNEHAFIIADPEKNARYAGKARILEAIVLSQSGNETLDDRLKDGSVFLSCMGVLWINEADNLIALCADLSEEKEAVPEEALCLLADGAEAFSLAREITARVNAFVNSGKNGADVRHAGNRQKKEAFFKWYYEKGVNYPSLDGAAATAKATGLFPFSFRTLRDWIYEAEKLRSRDRP